MLKIKRQQMSFEMASLLIHLAKVQNMKVGANFHLVKMKCLNRL